MRDPVQRGLLICNDDTGAPLAPAFDPSAAFAVTVSHPHKVVRETSREAYRVQRDIDTEKAAAGEETSRGQVLRCLAAFWNRHEYSPTAYELYEWMRDRGEKVLDVNSVRRRLSDLDGSLAETRAPRLCRVTKRTVMTWAVREQGSVAR